MDAAAAWGSVVTVAAVVVGGAISFATTWWLDRSRRRDERGARWDVRRLDALAEFATALKDEVRILLRVAGHHGFARTRPLAPAEAVEAHQEAEHLRSLRFEAVLMLCDRETVDAARAWQYAAWELQQLLLGDEAPTAEAFAALYAEANERREAFHDSARTSLAIARSTTAARAPAGASATGRY